MYCHDTMNYSLVFLLDETLTHKQTAQNKKAIFSDRNSDASHTNYLQLYVYIIIFNFCDLYVLWRNSNWQTVQHVSVASQNRSEDGLFEVGPLTRARLQQTELTII